MLNVAVVGMGWWGKIIVPLLKTSKKITVGKVVEVNPDSIADFAREQGVQVVTSYDDVLKDPAIQAVVLCTPHTQHTDQIVAAAAAGKHVFCETPLSMTRADVLRAVAAIEKAGVALAVGHERRFEPPILEMMQIVKSGVLGKPLQVEANFSQDKFLSLAADNWRLSGKEAPAGPMTATGIHLLDLSVGVFGEADHVYASVKQLGSHLVNGDTLAILVSFRNGGHALISAILATPFDGRFAIYCNEGWIEVRDKTHPEAPEGWTMTQCFRGGRREVKEFPPVPGVLANLEAFADAAEGRAPYPVPREQMIANISALEAIFKATKSGVVEKVEG
ncbi:MAG: Gfo/Idh/MocA family protein [bacterium]